MILEEDIEDNVVEYALGKTSQVYNFLVYKIKKSEK